MWFALQAVQLVAIRSQGLSEIYGEIRADLAALRRWQPPRVVYYGTMTAGGILCGTAWWATYCLAAGIPLSF